MSMSRVTLYKIYPLVSSDDLIFTTPWTTSPTDLCPEWFCTAFNYLQHPDLGAKFCELLKLYFRLEESSKFANEKGAVHALNSKHRPEAVHWWISRTRTGQPPIRDVNTFAKEFWTWWCGLQPPGGSCRCPHLLSPFSLCVQ